jgi:hypothetical protein
LAKALPRIARFLKQSFTQAPSLIGGEAIAVEIYYGTTS